MTIIRITGVRGEGVVDVGSSKLPQPQPHSAKQFSNSQLPPWRTRPHQQKWSFEEEEQDIENLKSLCVTVGSR